jgi:hypothetical protein
MMMTTLTTLMITRESGLREQFHVKQLQQQQLQQQLVRHMPRSAVDDVHKARRAACAHTQAYSSH